MGKRLPNFRRRYSPQCSALATHTRGCGRSAGIDEQVVSQIAPEPRQHPVFRDPSASVGAADHRVAVAAGRHDPQGQVVGGLANGESCPHDPCARCVGMVLDDHVGEAVLSAWRADVSFGSGGGELLDLTSARSDHGAVFHRDHGSAEQRSDSRKVTVVDELGIPVGGESVTGGGGRMQVKMIRAIRWPSADAFCSRA